ncbi:cytochrome p450 [Moniliophthora roreri]|nr:cytochrome p450 [Moniliophthora roreri]
MDRDTTLFGTEQIVQEVHLDGREWNLDDEAGKPVVKQHFISLCHHPNQETRFMGSLSMKERRIGTGWKKRVADPLYGVPHLPESLFTHIATLINLLNDPAWPNFS